MFFLRVALAYEIVGYLKLKGRNKNGMRQTIKTAAVHCYVE